MYPTCVIQYQQYEVAIAYCARCCVVVYTHVNEILLPIILCHAKYCMYVPKPCRCKTSKI